jgi:hypothetical protein
MRIAWWTPLVAIGAMALGPAACLGGVDREYADGGADTSSTTGNDATVDAPPDAPVEAAPGMDGGVAQDGDATVADVMVLPESSPPVDAPVEAPTGQTYDCNGQPVTSCAACANKPVECVFCASDGGHPGFCGPQGMYCINSAPSGAMGCTCPGGPSGNVALCPAPYQVCVYSGGIGGTFYCQTCGDNGSNMGACKGGGHCNGFTGMCQ